MAVQKNSVPATAPESQQDAPQLPSIDQESMTEAVADKTRPDAESREAPKNVVQYLGLVSERRISREEWDQAGVPDQDGVVWTRQTGNTVRLDHFSEAALRVLENNSEFRVIREEQ